jgi:hypothetical protein
MLTYTALSFQPHSIESRFGMDYRLIRCLASLADCVVQRMRLQQYTGSWLGTLSDDRIARDKQDLDLRTRSIKLELDAWNLHTSSSDRESRTTIGSLALWHACHILIHRDIEQATWADETLLLNASAVIDLCVQSSDKIEYLNWVSQIELVFRSCRMTDLATFVSHS